MSNAFACRIHASLRVQFHTTECTVEPDISISTKSASMEFLTQDNLRKEVPSVLYMEVPLYTLCALPFHSKSLPLLRF